MTVQHFDSESMRRRFGYLVGIVSRKYTDVVAGFLKPLGISPRQYALMGAVYGSELSQARLTTKLRVNKNVLVSLINELEHKKLCHRKLNPNNRREHFVVLTKTGEELVRKADQIVKKSQRGFLSPLSDDEQVQLCSMLNRLIKEELDM